MIITIGIMRPHSETEISKIIIICTQPFNISQKIDVYYDTHTHR